jgi:hypothetical protein
MRGCVGEQDCRRRGAAALAGKWSAVRAGAAFAVAPRSRFAAHLFVGAGVDRQFPLGTAGYAPAGITSGPDGALWFIGQNANKIGSRK